MEFLKDLSIDKVRNLAEDAFNQAKPKTDVEARVYEVLSHKNWGASSSLMHEIARDTFDVERFYVVTRLMWEGMENQRPAAWKIVFKALTLLEFLVKNGAERCVDDARNHGHVLKAMGQFNYYEGTIDRGLGVREKSKQIMEILGDDERIREERQKAKKLRQKFGSGGATASGGDRSQGYGNQDSWNKKSGGGGYGEGGIDSSPYESGGGYSGRYGGSRAGETTGSTPAPTFATIPDSKPKKTKKKVKSATGPPPAPAPAPAPAPEIDLFSFDDPAPVPAAQANNDFGAFQTTPAPAPVEDDEFGSFVASKTASQPDPFAAPTPQPAASPFDAFGNSGGVAPMAFVQNAPQVMHNNNVLGGNMNSMNDAFGNMTMVQPQQAAPSVGDDDFGDFAVASKSFSSNAPSIRADPMSKLVSLDGLSKNPNNPAKQNNAQNIGFGMGGMINTQTPNNTINNPQMSSGVVAAGGGDAISSLFAPPPVNNLQAMGMGMQSIQPQQQGMMSPQQGMMNPAMQQHGMMNQMGGIPQGIPQAGTVNPMIHQGIHGHNMMMGGGMQQQGMNPQMMQQGNMLGAQQGMYSQQPMGGMNTQQQMGGMNTQQQMGGMNTQQQMGGMNTQQQMGGMNMYGMGMNQPFR